MRNCVGPRVEAGACKHFIVCGADRKALHVPACGVRTTDNDDGDLLALTKVERLRGFQEAVLVAGFDRTHTRTVARGRRLSRRAPSASLPDDSPAGLAHTQICASRSPLREAPGADQTRLVSASNQILTALRIVTSCRVRAASALECER